MIIEEIDACLDEERHVAARDAIRRGLEASDDVTRWRLQLRRAELTASGDDEEQAIDDVLLLLEDLLAATKGRFEPELPRIHAARVLGFAQKRLPALAREAAVVAGQFADAAPVLVARGRAALWSDDRTGAAEHYRRAIEAAPGSPEPRLALAELLYVLGDFAACHAELDRLQPGGATWAQGARLRASCHAATQDHGKEIEAWRGLIAAMPRSDYAPNDGIALALALATAGQRAEALERFTQAWRADPEHPRGLYARRRIEHLEGAGPDAPRRWLRAFPTTVQKWNYCGPAVLELCLRYLGLELTQDEIAKVVKREGGTPMFEIVAYLEALGIEARRIEATPARLRAAIDLGLPVIVQEEYSTTSHVAVITGYDAALGLFVSQDPATRRPQLKSFEFTASAGQLYGNGGVIVLGRKGPELDPLRARATAAGLVHAAHLALLDDCDRRRPAALKEEHEDVALDEVVRLCDEAIALCPTFKLAHNRRFRALAALGDDARALEELHRIRTRFPRDEWTHRLHGFWLVEHGRHDEAFVEFFEAFRHDEEDAHSLENMGECRWLGGHLEAAERHALGAIALEPDHARAAETLAAVYLRQLQAVEPDRPLARRGSRARRADEPPRDATGVDSLPPGLLVTMVPRPPAELLRRALHFNRVASLAAPENPFNHAVAAELLVRKRDLEGAAREFREASRLDPEHPAADWGLAEVLERQGRHDEAAAIYEKTAARHDRVPDAYRSWASFLARRGKPERAEAVLVKGIAALEDGRIALIEPLVEVLEGAIPGSAPKRLREIGERFVADPVFLRAVAQTLDDAGARESAAALLRRLVESTPRDVEARYRLAELLLVDPRTRADARVHFRKALELAPTAVGPRCELAWLSLPNDARGGLALIEPLAELEDSRVRATKAALLDVQGRTADGLAALKLAIETEGEPVIGVLRLCTWHLATGRYDRVYDLLGRLPELPDTGPLAAWAEARLEQEVADRDEALAQFKAGSPELEAARRTWCQRVMGELWTWFGDPAFSAKLLGEGIAFLERSLARGPWIERALADTLRKRADAQVRLENLGGALADLERAARHFDKVAAASPIGVLELVDVLCARAELLLGLDRKDESRQAADRACRAISSLQAPAGEPELALAIAATRSRALVHRARACSEKTRKAATADAQQAVALLEADPDRLSEWVDATMTLADLHSAELEVDAARKVLERTNERLVHAMSEGADLADEYTEVTLKLSQVLCEQGKATAARDACKRLISRLETAEEVDTEKLASAYHSLGVVSLDLLSDAKGAVDAYTRAIDGSKNLDPGTVGNRAYAHLRAYQPERALTDGERVLEILRKLRGQRELPAAFFHVHEAPAHRSSAYAHALLGDVPAGLEACIRSLELLRAAGPDEDTAGHVAELKALLGELHVLDGKPEAGVVSAGEAVATLGELVERGRRQSEMDLVKALRAHASALAPEDPAKALAALERAEKITARVVQTGAAFQDVLADVSLRRALVFRKAGRREEARAALAHGRKVLVDAIRAGQGHLLPELIRHATAHVVAEPERASQVVSELIEAGRARSASSGRLKPQGSAPTSHPATLLVPRRRDRLVAALKDVGAFTRLEPTAVADLREVFAVG